MISYFNISIQPVVNFSLAISLNVLMRTSSNSFEAVFLTIALYYWLAANDEEKNKHWFIVHEKITQKELNILG